MANSKEGKKAAADCAMEYAMVSAKEIKENFNIKASNEEILRAFSEETYGKFLDKLLIPSECWRPSNNVSLKGSWDLKVFPENQKSDHDKTISKIKEVLSKKRPIGLSFCTESPLKVKSQSSCGENKEK